MRHISRTLFKPPQSHLKQNSRDTVPLRRLQRRSRVFRRSEPRAGAAFFRDILPESSREAKKNMLVLVLIMNSFKSIPVTRNEKYEEEEEEGFL